MLLRDASSARASATSSLFGVLNHCRSKMGERMLEQWLRQPLLDPAAIAKRHDIVELLAGLASERDALRDGTLKGLPDLDRLSVALRQQNAKLIDIYRLYTSHGSGRRCSTACAVCSRLEGDSADAARADRRAARELASFSGFDEMVETVLDLSQLPTSLSGLHGETRGARAELDDARRRLAIHENLTRQFREATDRTFDETAERENGRSSSRAPRRRARQRLRTSTRCGCPRRSTRTSCATHSAGALRSSHTSRTACTSPRASSAMRPRP